MKKHDRATGHETSAQKVALLIFPVCALLLVATQAFILTFVQVKGTSMVPTFREGQVLLVNRVAYGIQWPIIGDSGFFWNPPRAGDLVVVRRPDAARLVVKRVAAVGGQSLSISGHQLITTTGSVPLSPAQEYWLASCPRVPSGTLFVIGDNTVDSQDSRDWGFVPLENVVGTPWP